MSASRKRRWYNASAIQRRSAAGAHRWLIRLWRCWPDAVLDDGATCHAGTNDVVSLPERRQKVKMARAIAIFCTLTGAGAGDRLN